MPASFDIASSTDDCVIQPDGPLHIYFAHPVTSYDSSEESNVIAAIHRWIGPETIIVNPNTPEHAERYSALASDVETRARAFEYFLDLARQCNFCVFLPFDDRRIGSGVMAEIQTFFDRFKSEARIYEWIPVDDCFRMRDISYFARPCRVLTLEETRLRITQLRTKT